ncbi:MAG: hypothetical protein ABIJ05_04200 [Patescibacteria group bacterium]
MNFLTEAEGITNPALGTLKTKTGDNFFSSLIPALVGLAFVIGALLFFFTLILGAIDWITSGGDKTKLESARSKITNAIVGFVILLIAFAIVRIIQDFFKIDILILDIGQLIIR